MKEIIFIARKERKNKLRINGQRFRERKIC